MTLVGPPAPQDIHSPQSTALPKPVTLSVAGLGLIFLLVLITILVRPTPFADLDTIAASEAGALAENEPTTTANAEPRSSPESPAGAAASTTSRELRVRLAQTTRAGKLKEATDTLAQLVSTDARAVEDADVRNDVIELAAKTEYAGGREADRVFELLSTKMGAQGPELLYAIVTSKGGSKAANRAIPLLKQEDVRGRAKPATRINFDLWAAKTCPDKAALMSRARDDGDSRTLGWLQVIARNCQMSKDPSLQEAAAAIKGREK